MLTYRKISILSYVPEDVCIKYMHTFLKMGYLWQYFNKIKNVYLFTVFGNLVLMSRV